MPYIAFRDPVPMPEIVPYIARYDMGLFLLEPNTFNHRHFLPNKLFDFIQARLAVGVGPSPDMAELVGEYAVGVVSEDFTPQSFAAMLKRLRSEDIDLFKANAHKAASVLCWERNDEVIARTLQELLA
jgi:alkanesulfonate monooxygenase SsuD/methylene tetrahydromethanopterin reductase-like flavin-dependent oxidoreductase (luciferase family)